ncbi:MAG: type II toxin-antitoxin system death-on-curing family toxin [Chloroflexota bacterium]
MTSHGAPRYLSVADVVALHHFIMERLGYAPAPLRDSGLLESAVMRPQMAGYYEQADLIWQCALLAIGIAQAQAFVDGNKRTAFAAARAFLNVNDLRFTGDPIELAQQLEAVAEREGSLEAATGRFERWLRERVAPVSPA